MDSTTVRWNVAAESRLSLVRTARRMGLSAEDAEDVASEAILRAGNNDELDLATAQAWMRVVVRRLAVDLHRRRPSRSVLSRLAHADIPPEVPQDRIDDVDEARWVREATKGLVPTQQQVLLLRADGHSPREIAETLGCSYKTVESLTSRGRSQLRSLLAATLSGLGIAAGISRRGLVQAPAMATVTAAFAIACLGVGGTPTDATMTRSLASPAAAVTTRTAATDAHRLPAHVAAQHVRTTVRSARPAAGQAAATRVGSVQAGPVRYTGVRQTREHSDRTFVESVEDCLDGGVHPASDHLGCSAR